MSVNEGGDKAPKFADDESAADVFGEELWAEVKEICDKAYRLLGDEGSGAHGTAETARVWVDVPKGLLLIAQYVVARETLKHDWPAMEEALASKGKGGRAARAAVQEF